MYGSTRVVIAGGRTLCSESRTALTHLRRGQLTAGGRGPADGVQAVVRLRARPP